MQARELERDGKEMFETDGREVHVHLDIRARLQIFRGILCAGGRGCTASVRESAHLTFTFLSQTVYMRGFEYQNRVHACSNTTVFSYKLD